MNKNFNKNTENDKDLNSDVRKEFLRVLLNRINNNKALKGFVLLVLICLLAYEIFSGGKLTQILTPYLPQENNSQTTLATEAAPLTTAAPEIEHKLVITMLDVDQGDSILISYDDSHMLIDTNVVEHYSNVKNTLTERGVEHLDYLVATHPHADHIGAMHKVLTDFDVDTYYYTECDTGKYTYNNAMEHAYKYADEVELLVKGDKFKLGDVKFTVLSPVAGADHTENVNNASAVMLVEWGEFNALLMGDAESDIELELVKENLIPDVDLLKVGHHGSYTSSDKTFLQTAKPEVSLISLGEDNEYGFPHQVTLNKLEDIKTKVYRTDLNGNVTVTVGEEGKMKVK